MIGTTAMDLRTAQSFIPEFEVELTEERLSVLSFSERLSEFFLGKWKSRMPSNHPGPGITFVIGGFDEDEPYGSAYLLTIPNDPKPAEQAPNAFGATFGGQSEITSRLLHGYDPRVMEIAEQELGMQTQQLAAFKKSLDQLQLTIPFQVLPLQDCIDLAIFLIRTTATAQNLSIGIRGVGGAIDVAVITRREGLRIIQRKELAGEIGAQKRREVTHERDDHN